MIGAVIPVKTLSSAKSRLLPWLDRASVERLSIAMLGDLLESLKRVRAIDRIGVATTDRQLAKLAREAGAEVLSDAIEGLNPAVEAACARIAPAPDDAALVVLGDVAGAQPADIEALLAALGGRGIARDGRGIARDGREIARGGRGIALAGREIARAGRGIELARRGVALAASSDGGTSALLRRPRDIIPARFGADSARVHRGLAASAGVACNELALPSLAIDVDERADLEKLASSAMLGTRTRALLRELLPDLAT